jgi:AcrR family transcriptional regulator
VTSADRKATRRRGAALESDIFAAAWDELAEAGWSDFQMSRVAERAHASTATIYRRWPDRAALVAAIMNARHMDTERPTAITGDLRSDLLRLLRDQVELYRTPFGAAVRGLVSSLPANAEPRPAPAAVGPVMDILEASGEFPDPQRIPIAVINAGTDLVSHRYLGTGTGPDEATLEQIVDLIWLPSIQLAAAK